MKNIGGSLFNSSNDLILRPIPFGKAVFQVVPNEPLDTHHLVFSHNGKAAVVASHPNGFSCHVLAERIIKGDTQRIKEQADYIIACGGTSKSLDEILALVSV
jgi:hypothetical protein